MGCPYVRATLTGLQLYLHPSFALAYLVRRLRAGRGPALDRAVAQAEARAVTAALDRLAVELARLGERAAAVRAAVVDRVHVLAVADQQHGRVADGGGGGLVGLQIVRRERLGPLVRPLVVGGLVRSHAFREAEVAAQVAAEPEHRRAGGAQEARLRGRAFAAGGK